VGIVTTDDKQTASTNGQVAGFGNIGINLGLAKAGLGGKAEIIRKNSRQTTKHYSYPAEINISAGSKGGNFAMWDFNHLEGTALRSQYDVNISFALNKNMAQITEGKGLIKIKPTVRIDKKLLKKDEQGHEVSAARDLYLIISEQK
jgi:hypothetical protein